MGHPMELGTIKWFLYYTFIEEPVYYTSHFQVQTSDDCWKKQIHSSMVQCEQLMTTYQ